MTELFASPTLMGLLLEAAGVMMIAILCLMLMRTIRRPPLVPWTAAWIALLISLTTLLMALQMPAAAPVLLPIYIFFEYGFGYLVFAGCREYASGRPIGAGDWPVAAALAVPAIALPVAARGQFNVFFAFHSMLDAYLFFLAWRQLRAVTPGSRTAAGLSVLRFALVLLLLVSLCYAPASAMSNLGWIEHDPPFLAYASLYDLLLLMMLGFGMIMVATGEVQSDLEVARDRLAGVAQTDHLTSAFNRYAFQTIRDRHLAGTAVIADIDNLKSINDQYGHASGDAAIRAVATAIRSCIRADDLLFRWGGDEFLVLLVGVGETDARARLASVNGLLRAVSVVGREDTLSVSVSMGFAAFDSSHSLDAVIRVADQAMYGTKRATPV